MVLGQRYKFISNLLLFVPLEKGIKAYLHSSYLANNEVVVEATVHLCSQN